MTTDSDQDPKTSPSTKNDLTTIFFSYSRKDQAQAVPIINAIQKAGYNVWWDGMLEGGTSYLETTEEALESAKAVVVLWTETSIKSHWVRDEAMSGRSRARLLPLSLDGAEPPLGFRQIQVIDFSNWYQDTNSPEFTNLIRGLAHFHNEEYAGGGFVPGKAPRFRPLSRRAIFMGAGGLTAGLLGGFIYTGGLRPGGRALPNSLAVMPFDNLSGDGAHDYIANGLPTEIRSHLARNKSLKVVARSSSIAAAKEALSVKALTEKLGVSYLLEGYIQKSNDKIQVTSSLIEGRTEFTRWTKDYTDFSDQMLLVQTAIVEAVLNKLSIETSSSDPTLRGATLNPAAYNEYLRGNELFRDFKSRESLLEALEYFNSALRLDPEFGAALTGKAQLLLLLGTTSSKVETAQDYISQAEAAALQAVQVSPEMAEAHSALGYIRMATLDFAGAREPYRKSNELNNGDAAIFARYALFMTVVGEAENAIQQIGRAIDLDPLNVTMHNTAGLVHYAARDYDSAAASYRRVLELSPSFFNAHAYLGLSLIRSGQIEAGLEACAKEKNDMERLPCLAIGRHMQGDQSGAQAAYDELVEQFGDAGAYQQLQVLAEWNEQERAMDVMNKAVDLKDTGLNMSAFDPALDGLRDRPDFRELLDELGLGR